MLRIDHTDVLYGKVQALFDITVDVQYGQIVSLLGSNGAGKTTIMQAIMGFLKLSRGSIYFENNKIDSLPTHQIVKRGIALVPEARELFLDMTVKENLNIGAYIRKSAKEINEDVKIAFRYFPILEKRLQQPAGTLSGGEQQMLAIARCLMIKPRLLLLDEPSLGLAPIIVNEIFNIISEINRRGVTILLVEQNANMALSISEQAYILETGKVVFSGKSNDLLSNGEVKRIYLGE